MDPPEAAVSLAEIANDLLRDMLLVMPFRAILSLSHSSKSLNLAILPSISEDRFWYERLLARHGARYTGPHPMTLALIIDAFADQSDRGDTLTYMLRNVVVGVNIPEIIRFYIDDGFKLGITKQQAIFDVIATTSLLVDKSILKEAIELAGNDEDAIQNIIDVLDEADIDDYIPETIDISLLLGRTYRHENELARLYIKELPLTAGDRDSINIVIESTEIRPEYLLEYSKDVESTAILLTSTHDTLQESVRVACLKGLKSMITDEVRALYIKRIPNFEQYPTSLPRSRPDIASACLAEYGVVTASYPEVFYNLARCRNIEALIVLVELGLDEHISQYIFLHPELSFNIFLWLSKNGKYAIIRNNPQLVTYLSHPGVEKYASLPTADVLRIAAEAPDIVEILLANMPLYYPATKKELSDNPLTSKYFAEK